jgi:hypothetical protein
MLVMCKGKSKEIAVLNWVPRYEDLWEGGGGITPRFLNFGSTPQPICHREKRSPRYSTDRRLHESQSRSWCGFEEEKSLPLPESNPGRPARSPVTLYWLNYPDLCLWPICQTYLVRHCQETDPTHSATVIMQISEVGWDCDLYRSQIIRVMIPDCEVMAEW